MAPNTSDLLATEMAAYGPELDGSSRPTRMMSAFWRSPRRTKPTKAADRSMERVRSRAACSRSERVGRRVVPCPSGQEAGVDGGHDLAEQEAEGEARDAAAGGGEAEDEHHPDPDLHHQVQPEAGVAAVALEDGPVEAEEEPHPPGDQYGGHPAGTGQAEGGGQGLLDGQGEHRPDGQPDRGSVGPAGWSTGGPPPGGPRRWRRRCVGRRRPAGPSRAWTGRRTARAAGPRHRTGGG